MDWIYVKHGSAENLRDAIFAHAEIASPEVPKTFAFGISELSAGGLAVLLDTPIPAYDFTNLVGWLNQPTNLGLVSDATGWITSLGSGSRYFLRPDSNNPAGDTLLGATNDGTSVSVYLPDVAMCEIRNPVSFVDESQFLLPRSQHVMSFDVVLDANPAFGNPEFVVTRAPDTQW